MKKELLVLSTALLLAGAGCAASTSTTVQTEQQPKPTTNTQPTANVNAAVNIEAKVKTESSVRVVPQNVGTVVMVDSVTMTDPGYVVIHVEDKGSLGAVVGNSALLAAGTTANVRISLTNPFKLQSGVRYYAEIHKDNGNRSFDAQEDAAVKAASGDSAMTMFTVLAAKAEGTPSVNAGVNTNTSLKVNLPPVVASVKHTVTIANFAYSPASLTVKKGDTIVFTNNDSMGHTVTGDTFASALLSTGGVYTLNTASLSVGSHSYHCTPHPNMIGTIIVQ